MIKKINEDKRAWIKIAESALAVLLLASVILVIMARQAQPRDVSDEMYKLQHTILDEASRSETIRAAVLTGNMQVVKEFIYERLPAGYSFNISICKPGEACTAEVPEEEIYVDDILISSTLLQYNPRKLKFYMWIGGVATGICESQGYMCCISCDAGTEHPEHDSGCASGLNCCDSCSNLVTCYDGIKNQQEVGTDCGGPCPACPPSPDCISQSYGTDCSDICTICDGAGYCINTPLDEDYQNECDGISCSADGYYYGWLGASCHYRADINPNQHSCDGFGFCPTAASACPLQNQGSAALDCGSVECINYETCIGTTPGVCYTSGRHLCEPGYECDATGTCSPA